MKKAAQSAPEERGAGGILRLGLWAAGLLVLYVLGSGPLVMLSSRNLLPDSVLNVLEKIYAPVEWAYEETLLHKPIGIYLHLWSKDFDKDGDQK
jgi:hypothetical protein